MEIAEILAWGRLAERLLICTTGTLSLVMGWNLFRIGIVDPQSAELSVKDWTVKLQKGGPGIFFALFGTALLAWAIHSPLVVGPDPKTGKEQWVSYFGEANDSEARRAAQSINTVAISARDESLLRNLPPPQRSLLLAAVTNLEAQRDSLVRKHFGSESFANYQASAERFQVSPGLFSQEQQREFTEIRDWMTGFLPTLDAAEPTN